MNNIKKARLMAELTQEELAEKIGTKKGNISRLENDFFMPSASTLIKLADELKVTTDYLLGRE